MIEATRLEIIAEIGVNHDGSLAKAQRLVQAGKNVVVVKGGRSSAGSRAVQSHTGAMAGDDRVVSAIFRETGVIRARDSVSAVDG